MNVNVLGNRDLTLSGTFTFTITSTFTWGDKVRLAGSFASLLEGEVSASAFLDRKQKLGASTTLVRWWAPRFKISRICSASYPRKTLKAGLFIK